MFRGFSPEKQLNETQLTFKDTLDFLVFLNFLYTQMYNKGQRSGKNRVCVLSFCLA